MRFALNGVPQPLQVPLDHRNPVVQHVGAAMGVEHRHMRQRDAGRFGGGHHPQGQFRRIGIGPAVGVVVQVVELADVAVAPLQQLGIEAVTDSTPASTRAFVTAEIAKWRDVIRASGAKVD